MTENFTNNAIASFATATKVQLASDRKYLRSMTPDDRMNAGDIEDRISMHEENLASQPRPLIYASRGGSIVLIGTAGYHASDIDPSDELLIIVGGKYHQIDRDGMLTGRSMALSA
jgi:hypothetical protein